MSTTIIKEKLEQAVGILNEKNIDMWITFVRESSTSPDPVLEMIAGINVTWQTAFIICADGEKTAIIGDMEIDNIKRIGAYQNVIGYQKSIKDELANYIKKKNPQKIAINYSKNSNLADGLSHGMYLILLDHLSGTDYENKLISAEEVIAALKGRKSQTEIEIMQEAIDETLKIFKKVSDFIRPGKSEIDVAKFIKSIAEEKGFELAWDEDHCPAVFTGPNAGNAHSGPTENKIEKGHMVNIDFGIKYKGYCSDLQRTWYVLKDNEQEAPAEVKKGFEIIRDAIRKVADNLKPGVKGVDMDTLARDYITGLGYEEYPHGLGHQVGRQVHDGGAGLLPNWERYGNNPFIAVEENQIFTIEPRLKVEGYGTSTLEEEVIITKDGCRFMSDPQEEIWLIGTK